MGEGHSGRQSLFEDEIAGIVSIVLSGECQDRVILIVPSHDRSNKPLQDQDIWADAAARLFAELYRGATAFKAHTGVFTTRDYSPQRAQSTQRLL